MLVAVLLDGELEKCTRKEKYWEVKWLAILFTEQLAWEVFLLLFLLFFSYVCRIKFRQIKCSWALISDQ